MCSEPLQCDHGCVLENAPVYDEGRGGVISDFLTAWLPCASYSPPPTSLVQPFPSFLLCYLELGAVILIAFLIACFNGVSIVVHTSQICTKFLAEVPCPRAVLRSEG